MTDSHPYDLPPAHAGTLLERIDASHAQMRFWLVELANLVNHMEDRGWDTWARDHARSVIDYFSRGARQFHQELDRQLFPRVAALGDAALDEQIRQLRQDQGWLEESWYELQAQLQPVAEGFSGCDVDILRDSADVHAALLLEHLAREREFVAAAEQACAALQPASAETRVAATSATASATSQSA